MASKKVLVVDDEPAFTQLLVEYLRATGFEALSAEGAQQGIELFRKHKPRAVILDFNMPFLSGDQFLPVLQSVDPLVKVIVISGCIEEEVEEKFRGLGYFCFFEKSTLSLEKLKQKIDEALTYSH